MSKKKGKLSFGVLIDSLYLKKWQAECIRNLLGVEGVVFDCFIQNTGASSYAQIKPSIAYRFLERTVRNKGPLKLESIRTIPTENDLLQIVPEVKKNVFFIKDQDLEYLKSKDLDFLLRFGFGILKGDILTLPTFGIWSFHHADISKIRGGPAGFWDIYKNHQVNGAVLQQLNSKLDGGVVLKEGYYSSISHSFQHNLYRILELSTGWPALVAKNIILNGHSDSPNRSNNKKAELFKTPTNAQVAFFVFKVFLNKLKFHWKELFLAEFWNIGVAHQPIEDFLKNSIPNISWMPLTENEGYSADPFAASQNKDTVFFESFDYHKFKGQLNRVDFKDGKWENQKLLFEKNSHLSYPFAVSSNQQDFLLAENHENYTLTLYTLSNNYSVKPHKTLLQGEWIDPTSFFHNQIHWLFCTKKGTANEELHLFYSNSIDGKYTAHPLNPVVTDVRNARPAGTPFYHQGNWYRPAQNCSSSYGGSIQLMKIETINVTKYAESKVIEIEPTQFEKYNQGVHTLSKFGNLTLIDGKESHFSFANFKNRLKHKLKKRFTIDR